MKIAYPHLINFFEQQPSIQEVSNNLFQLGHENEIVGDILDIEFTPNRGDCLSLLGLARDLGIFYNVIEPQSYYKNELPPLEIKFKNHSPNDCPNISFLSIVIDEIPSVYEDYLEDYFSTFKINKNNFFTDISNYIAYEMGQPTHCYDSSTINGEIEFISKNLNENFYTLLDKEITLSGKNCIFKSNHKVINLAGIMGDKSTACSNDTKNVLIECAYFKPESIIGKAQKYNLNSDASYKFERGVDPSIQEQTLRRFIKIVTDHANIKDIKYKNFMSNDLPLKKIKFDPPKIHKILGTEVRDAIYKDSLTKIGFEIKDNQIVIPSFRHDIAHQNDLAEEMARIIGYDNIKPVNFEIATGKSSKNDQGENLLRYYLASKGFNEVINMPFASCNTASLKIDNPLDSNRGFLRTSIENSLIENLLYNEKRQKESIKLFEISDIYSIKKDGEVQVNQYLGIIVSGRLGNNYNEFSKKLDSQYLIDLFKLNQKQVFEISRNELDTKIKNKIFMVLLKFEDLPESLTNLENQRMHKINFNTYEPISEFPSSARDLSFVLSNEKKIKKLEDIILNYKTDTLKSAFVFDFYNNNTGQIKIGFRLIFNSNNKTLTVDEVDNKIDDIVKSCMEIGGVEIPGYSK
jgi:phenylalanyl-tRNA synthetase beta chain